MIIQIGWRKSTSKMVIFYSFLIQQISLVKIKIVMKNTNDSGHIGLFSHLIEIILNCRLSSENSFRKHIASLTVKMDSLSQEEKFNLNDGIQRISKLYKLSQFQVHEMLQQHFSNNQGNKYEIYLEIYEFLYPKQQYINFAKLYKKRVLEKWVFRKQQLNKTFKPEFQQQQKQSDLILKVLHSLNEQIKQESQENNNNIHNTGNTTHTQGYQLIIKSKCSKNHKNMIYVLHHENKIDQFQTYTNNIKTSLDEFPKYWQKTLQFDTENSISVGCYYSGLQKIQSELQIEMKMEMIDFQIIQQQPDRKLSSETKAQQKQKDSTSSFRLSLSNFSFRLSGSKGFKLSMDANPTRKNTQEAQRHNRPRYQSIYESKDEQMNIFILSPRKLSEQESPKIRNFQQKTIQFQIRGQNYVNEISEQMIQELILDQNDHTSNNSSDGFQMLQENDHFNSINQERSRKLIQQEQKQNTKQKQRMSIITNLQSSVLQLLKKMDQVLLY